MNSGCYCGKYKGIKFRGVLCELCETEAWGVERKLDSALKVESLYNFSLTRANYWKYFNSSKVKTEDIVRHLEWLKRRNPA